MADGQQVAPMHAMKDKSTTWCGLVVGKKQNPKWQDEGTLAPAALIAPSLEEATCFDCKNASPTTQQRSQQIVSARLDKEAERFAKRKGAPPPDPSEEIDPKEVAAQVLAKKAGD
jgi:hypothetical protein